MNSNVFRYSFNDIEPGAIKILDAFKTMLNAELENSKRQLEESSIKYFQRAIFSGK